MSESVRVGLVGICGVRAAGGWFAMGVWVSAFTRERLGLRFVAGRAGRCRPWGWLEDAGVGVSLVRLERAASGSRPARW